MRVHETAARALRVFVAGTTFDSESEKKNVFYTPAYGTDQKPFRVSLLMAARYVLFGIFLIFFINLFIAIAAVGYAGIARARAEESVEYYY